MNRWDLRVVLDESSWVKTQLDLIWCFFYHALNDRLDFLVAFVMGTAELRHFQVVAWERDAGIARKNSTVLGHNLQEC